MARIIQRLIFLNWSVCAFAVIGISRLSFPSLRLTVHNYPRRFSIYGGENRIMFERWARRIKKMSTAQVVSLAFTISISVFAIWTFLAALVWGALQILGVRFSYWEMLEAVSTAAAVAQVFGGGVVALVQLSESVDNRNLGIYNDVFEKMMSDENIEARRWIYQQLPPL